MDGNPLNFNNFMRRLLSESEVENHILELFKGLGYEIKLGSLLYPDGPPKGISNERENYSQIILKERLNTCKFRI